MALALLYDMPADELGFAEWGFANSAHHLDIINEIFRTKGQLLPQFVLDPIPIDDMGGWLEHHSIMHQNQNQVLGIAGHDLSELNWRDPRQFSAWIQQHADEHMQAAQILGVG